MLRHYRWMFVAASMFAALSVGRADAEDAKLFRWKLKPGQTLKFRMVQDMQQNLELTTPNVPTAVSTKMTMDMAWKVDSVDKQGVITIDQQFERIQMKMQTAQGVMMDYDSAAGKEPQGMTKMIAPIFEAMLKKPIRTAFTARGELKKVKLPAGILESLNKTAGGQFGNILSDDSMKQMGMISKFPEAPIKLGESWSQEATMKFPVLGNTVVKTTFRYEGTETRDSVALDKIALSMNMKTEDNKQDGEAKETPKKKDLVAGFTGWEGKGTLYFDNVAGRVVESRMTMKMKIKVNVMGQSIVQDLDMKVHMSPLPAEVAAPSEKGK
jgi:hypothetical protein